MPETSTDQLSLGPPKKSLTREDYAQLEKDSAPPPRLPIRFADSRRIIAAGLLIVVLFFGIGGVWVSVAQITGAVIASGELRVDTERKTVQHLEGGIVREILVRNGDIVTVGQPMLTLDSSRIVSAVDQLRLQIAAARLEEARLAAEKNMLATVDWPANDLEVPLPEYTGLFDSVRKVFTSGREALENQLNLLGKQIDQLRQQEQSYIGRLAAEGEIIATLQEELDAKMILFQQEYIDRASILSLQRAIAEHAGMQAQLRGSQAEVREKMAEFELRITSMKNEYQQEAITRLYEVQQRLFDLQQQLLPLLDARERLTVTAPVAGEVVALQVHSEGGVLGPGQPIADIVPAGSPLIIECTILVKDITHLYKGQEADVQLLAFNQRSTPKIPGTVNYISADRLMRPTPYGEQPVYIVHVEIDKQALAEHDLYVTPGMPAAVYIRTKPRTVLDYILEPILVNFEKALREN
jgi:HlyD family type I secretion membrane fusion protein